MEITYTCKKTNWVFDYGTMVKHIGMDLTRLIKRRVNELKSYKNFQELLDAGIGKPEKLTNKDNYHSIRLNKNYRLIIRPIIATYERETLISCEEIEIRGVVDYHGGKENWIIK